MIKAFLSRPLWVQPHVANHLRQLEKHLEGMGFELKTVGINETAFASPFEEVVGVLKTCDCAIILESVDIQASQMMAAARATKEANRCASLS